VRPFFYLSFQHVSLNSQNLQRKPATPDTLATQQTDGNYGLAHPRLPFCVTKASVLPLLATVRIGKHSTTVLPCATLRRAPNQKLFTAWLTTTESKEGSLSVCLFRVSKSCFPLRSWKSSTKQAGVGTLDHGRGTRSATRRNAATDGEPCEAGRPSTDSGRNLPCVQPSQHPCVVFQV